jgi:thiamine kinase-like enzyme
MKPIQPNYTNDLKKISKQITELASEIQEIKELLQSKNENSNGNGMYPWHLENSTTTAEFHEE